MTTKKDVVLNIIWTALGTATLGVIGWLCLSVIHLQNQYAAETAEKMLRQDVTDVMNDVDKRLAVIEALMTRSSIPMPEPAAPAPTFAPDPIDVPSGLFSNDAEEAPQQQQFPRYDLRQQKLDN